MEAAALAGKSSYFSFSGSLAILRGTAQGQSRLRGWGATPSGGWGVRTQSPLAGPGCYLLSLQKTSEEGPAGKV